jgi:hypothetical protein
VIGKVDRWLAREFTPHRLAVTIRELAQGIPADTSDGSREAKRRIAECDRKLAQYRAALDAGATPRRSPGGSPRPKPRSRITP